MTPTRSGKFFTAMERLFLVLTFFLATAPIIPVVRLVRSGTGYLTSGDPLMQALWLVDYLVLFLLIALNWRQFLAAMTRDKLMLALIVLVVISVGWSAIPLVTVRRGFALVCTTMIGVYLGMRYRISDQLRLLAWALGLAAVLSVVFALLLPNFGLETSGDHIGLWRGIYHQKNVLGRYMSLGGVVFLLLGLSVRRHRWVCWLFFLLSIALLLLSGSKNALVSLLVAWVLIPPAAAMRLPVSLKLPLLFLFLIFGSGIATLIFADLEGVFGLLGKDATLTGRTDLWPSLLEMWQEQPILGYGYSGFWAGWDGPSAEIWKEFFWHPRHAHNGFLQVLLELGVVGVGLFMLRFIAAFPTAIAWVRSTKQAADLWPLIYLPFMFLSNIAESVVLAQNNIFWILYVALLCSLTGRSSSPIPLASDPTHLALERRRNAHPLPLP